MSGAKDKGWSDPMCSLAAMLIREAEEEDWSEIRPFFSAIVSAGDTFAYPEPVEVESGRELWMEPPPGQTVVAVHADSVVGSAKMGPNRPGRGAHVATASFMVDPTRRGQGVGRALGLYVLDWARNAAYHSMQFNAVVETNTGARSLRSPRSRAGRPPCHVPKVEGSGLATSRLTWCGPLT